MVWPCQNLKVAYVTKNSCMVSWENPEDYGGTEITQYRVECRQPSQRGWTILSNDLTKRQMKAPLTEGCEYFFRVSAENKIGSGPSIESKTAVLAVDPIEKPGEPIDFHIAEIGKTFCFIKWKRPDYDGGSRAIGYHVEKKPKEAEDWERLHKGAIKETYFMADRCIENQVYQDDLLVKDIIKLLVTGARRTDSGKYVITASTIAGTCSADAKVNVLDRPGPISDLKVSGITTDRCHLAWEVPEDDGGCEIYNYIIEKCETKRGVWSVHSNAVITNKANVTRLIEGNEYTFRVRAENKMGPGPAVQSEAIVAGTQFNVPGAPDTPVITKIAKEEMSVEWSEPDRDGGKPITGYLLEKKEEHAVRWSPVNKDAIPGTRLTVTGLLPLHEYQYRVKAVNEIGVGAASKASLAITAKDAIGKQSTLNKMTMFRTEQC